TASSDTDAILSMVLKKFDPPSDKVFVDELPLGSLFRTPNGRVFKKGKLRVKLFACTDIKNNNVYLFKPNAQVELLKTLTDEYTLLRHNYGRWCRIALLAGKYARISETTSRYAANRRNFGSKTLYPFKSVNSQRKYFNSYKRYISR